MTKSFKRTQRRFLQDTHGNMSTMFALSMTFLMTVIGAGIDYGRVQHQESIANSIVDTVAIAALSAAVEADKAKKTNAAAVAVGQAAGFEAWKANAKAMKFDVDGQPTIDVAGNTNHEWTVKVAFSEDYSTKFMSLFGGNDVFPVKAYSEATSSFGEIKEYWDIHLAVDTSASMGLGSTQAIMNQMLADPQMMNCSFACHMQSGSYNTMPIAKSKGYKLRIDVVDEAIDAVASKLKTISSGDNIRMALHGFDDSFSQLVTKTTNLDDIMNHDLQMKKVTGSYGNTNFRIGFQALEAQVGKAGDGASSNKAKNAAIIITDGVHDHSINEVNVVTNLGQHYKLGPISPTFCQKMKDNGAKVGVLYVPYITPAGYGGYTNAYINDVPKKLKDCASPDMYFEATQSSQIEGMLSTLIQQAFGSDSALRLTQ